MKEVKGNQLISALSSIGAYEDEVEEAERQKNTFSSSPTLSPSFCLFISLLSLSVGLIMILC